MDPPILHADWRDHFKFGGTLVCAQAVSILAGPGKLCWWTYAAHEDLA